jgi:hypothetical protein
MKKIVILALGLFVALAATSPVNATVKPLDSVPAVVSTVTPEINSFYANSKLELAFVVNENGKAVDIKSVTKADPELVETLSEAVSKWTFTPATRNGTPVAAKVLLPVIVKG